ncbi:MAG: hypothetical protein ACLFQ5_00550 [Oceanicaulis sp.]
MSRLATLAFGALALIALQGCLAMQTVGVAAGAAGAAASAAGDVAEGAAKLVIPGDGDVDEDGED